MTQAILEGKGLSKKFARGAASRLDRTAREFVAVDSEIHRGETLAIVGESGCGKTTLARMLLWLIAPDSGEVFFEGSDLRKLGAQELRNTRRALAVS